MEKYPEEFVELIVKQLEKIKKTARIRTKIALEAKKTANQTC